MGNYVTAEAFLDYMRVDPNLQPAATDAANLAILAAEATIEGACRRNFIVPADDAEATTRYYRPDRYSCPIDDLADDTGLAVTDDGDDVDLADIQLEPLNGIGPNMLPGWPITRLRALGGCWTTDLRGTASVGVTSARWGWLATPQPIVEATKLVAKDVYNEAKVAFGSPEVAFDLAGQVLARNAMAANMLERYKRTGRIIGQAHVRAL